MRTPRWGGWRIGGIAAGTVCGYGISMCALLFIMLRRRKKIFAGRENESLEELVKERGEHYAPPLYLSFSHLRPDMGMQKRILKIGLPQAVEVFGMWGIQMFCLSIISELPIKGVLGVHNIAVRIESLSFLPGFAIGHGGLHPGGAVPGEPGTRSWPASPSGNACGTPSSS